MTKTQETILACLKINVDRAKSKAMREFAQARLDDYTQTLARRAYIKQSNNPGARFADKLENEQ